MLYRIGDGNELVPVPETSTSDEGLFEADVETLIEGNPGTLDEDLLIIGRQVDVEGRTDRLDLLAVDLEGNLVVIELKRDRVSVDAVMQAVRYAAITSKWTRQEIRQTAESYWLASAPGRGDFADELDSFCDEDYELNGDQRIIVAGRMAGGEVDPRVAGTALWLHRRGVRVRVVAIEMYKDGKDVYLHPRTVIPLTTEDEVVTRAAPRGTDREWKVDGQRWHLDKQLADDGREIVDRLLVVVPEVVPDVEGPSFGQKNYFAWRHGGRNWVRCYTDNPHQAALMIRGLEEYSEQELADRVGLPAKSALDDLTQSRLDSGKWDETWVTLKSRADLEACEANLRELLRDAWAGFTGATT